PRPQNYDAIFPDEWRDYVNSIHPLVYWSTFRQIPEDTLQVMWETWGGYGLPIIPVFQGDAPINEQQAALNKLADEDWNIQGVSWWRLGVIEDYEVINQSPSVKCAS
ncbi:MAG: hypothetical protein KJ043_20530, partial [Anaerolineae bacterium]|nr:hypothetical protein [Anaerolineae bacterium]